MKSRRRALRLEQLEPRRLLAYDITNLGQAARLGDMQGDWMTFAVNEARQGNTDLNGDGDTSDYVLHVHHLPTGATTNLGLASWIGDRVVDNHAVFLVSESGQGGTDLNGDGDASDTVLHVYDTATGQLTNVGLDTYVARFDASANLVVLLVNEWSQGATDLNGDGDASDEVLHVYDMDTGQLTNVGIEALSFDLDGTRVAFAVSEAGQGNADLNGDADVGDVVLHVYDADTGAVTNLGLDVEGAAGRGFDLEGDRVALRVGESRQGGSDLNGDGDTSDTVLHVVNLATATTTNLGLATLDFDFDGGRVALEVIEADQGGSDLNGDGDALDTVLHVHDAVAGTTLNLQLATESNPGVNDFDFVGDVLAVRVSEYSQGGNDLNGDGNVYASVLHAIDAGGGITNLGISAGELVTTGHRVAFAVREGAQGPTDLNGDGDIADHVLAIFDADVGTVTVLPFAIDSDSVLTGRTQLGENHVAFAVPEADQGQLDLNGDGDALDRVLHVHDFVFGTTTNFAVLAPDDRYFRLEGDRLAFLLGEWDGDLNGDGDARDSVLQLSLLSPDPIVMMFEQLVDDLDGLQLPSGTENSLSVKLVGALEKYLAEAGDSQHAAVEKLEALIQAIEAQRDKRIASADADELIADVRALIDLIQEQLLVTLENA